ncbi:MAG: hypothetical protein ACFFD2_24590, partial [Promethearchaeota archaeon]
INSFYLLKKKEFYEAWCEMEKCEKRIQYLSEHFNINEETDTFSIAFIKKQVEKFQAIYPKYIFTSYQLAIESTVCSICGRENSLRNHCGHRLREIYNGRRCVRYIKKCKPLHTAIVENPKWKYRVLFSTNEKREKVDNYNYSIIEYLIDILPSPFVEWNYIYSVKINPHSKFKNYREDDECPCGSDNLYQDCCLKKEGVPRPHIDFYGFEPIYEPEIKDDFSILKPKRLDNSDRGINEAKKDIILTGISASADSFFID